MKGCLKMEIAFPVLLLLFALLFIAVAMPYPYKARLLPQMVGVVTVVLCVAEIVKQYREVVVKRSEHLSIEPVRLRRMLTTGVSIVVYILCVTAFGFMVSSIVYVTLLARYLGAKNILKNVAVAAILTLATYFGFNNLLHIFLPKGLLI